MSTLYTPTVTIGDQVIPSSWDGSHLVALDHLEINWGRPDLYAANAPAELALTVIDPNGFWGADPALMGLPVLIRRDPDDVVGFRGRINGVSLDPATVTNPDTGQQVDVFLVKLTAADVLADLAMAILPGPGDTTVAGENPRDFEDELGNGYWPTTSSPAARIIHLMNAGGADLVDSIQEPDASFLRLHTFSEGKSLLDLLQLMYSATEVLAHVQYDPDTNGIVVGRPAEASGITLTYSADTITMAPATGYFVDSGRLHYTAGKTLTSTAGSAIDIVQLGWSKPDVGQPAVSATSIIPLKAQATTEHFDPAATGNRVLLIDSDNYYVLTPSDMPQRIADAVDGVNGRLQLPRLLFDFRYGPSGDTDLDELLLDTRSHEDPLYLTDSLAGGFPAASGQWQLIGGTLRWLAHRPGSSVDAGWQAELVLAPAAGIPDVVNINELVTDTAAGYDDFDPTITLADLAQVTTGAS